MAVRQGTVSGSVATVAFNIPCRILSAYLTNRSGADLIVNVYVVTDTGDRKIVDTTMVSRLVYVLDVPLILKAGWYLIIVSNGSLDYFFSFE